MRDTIRRVHQKLTLQYRLDIWLGYTLDTNESRDYLPSYNTGIFEDGTPLINTSISDVLDKISCEEFIDNSKRPNSKWVFQKFREYVLIITVIPECLIGASIKLPDYIKLSKSIIGFETVPNNLCFWFCLAKYLNPNKRIDRLRTVVNQFFESFYNKNNSEHYVGLKQSELENIENHFKLQINVYEYAPESCTLIKHSSNNSNKL